MKVGNVNNMKKLGIILSVFVLISCKEKIDYHYQDKIIGHWTEVLRDEFEPRKIIENDTSVVLLDLSPPIRHYNFSFLEKGEFINRSGFFKKIDGKDFEDRRLLFLGTKTKYIIDSDSLKILDKVSNQYDKYRILSLDNSKLCLIKDRKDTLYFKKRAYVLKCKDTFDKIVISSSGCYGTCPVSTVLIDKSGEFIFEGEFYTTNLGLYKSKISKEKFDEILESFQKSNWKNLKDDYKARHTDDERISVVFIKNNKIVKSISDYGHESPEEFIWAYSPLRFLYQQVKLERIDEKNISSFENVKLLKKLRNYPVPKLIIN